MENSLSYNKKLNDLTAKKAQSLQTYYINGYKIQEPEKFTNNFAAFK